MCVLDLRLFYFGQIIVVIDCCCFNYSYMAYVASKSDFQNKDRFENLSCSQCYPFSTTGNIVFAFEKVCYIHTGHLTTIAHRIEVIDHPGSGDDDGWTERNLYITITAKTAEEMKTAYHFNRNQIAALDELLEQRDLLLELIEDVYSVSGDTASLIRGLPEDLSPEREAVVRTACSLVGKVNYFWGGKSLVIGWDARWGEVRQVTAAGSSTTGTYRPYGLDCSGFVDWVFYNQSGGSYVIGHGGGATMQHSYCTDISWADAQPGDLVFYPDNSHVGIVGGRDANGELLIIHCASGYNNVVITGLEGFTSVGRPRYCGE